MARKIVISEFMDDAAIEMLKSSFDVHYDPELGLDRTALIEALADADALIVRNCTRVNEELLARAARLVVVGRLGVGLDNIDVDYCARRGVQVIPATGANAMAVAEYVVSMAMVLLRGFLFSSDRVAQGEWPRMQLSAGREVAGKTIGLAGFGSVGQTVAQLARTVRMRVIAYDPRLPPSDPAWHSVSLCSDLDELFSSADVVSLHVPLTPENAGLVGARTLGLMKKGAVLINTARGGIVNEAALAAALKAGTIAAAALDVFGHEPLAPDSVLAGTPNLFLTPHIAGVTRESNERVSARIAQRVGEILSSLTGQ